MGVGLCHLIKGCLDREEGFLERLPHALHID
jgi:hypothetical protein